MSKTCAKCQKTVYPIEELKCLDKIWHKGCFKCHECGMTLNMKTYKGFNKLPYCEAHIPKAKATTVAETPELKRIQENTKNQSNAVYHAEFEKSKGKFTPVVDDPESLRIKQNTKIISNVAYHGELEKKAIMEQKRNLSGEGDHNKNGVAPPKSPSYLDELGSLPTPQPVAHSQQQQQQSQYAGHPQYRQPPSNSSSYNSSSSRQGSNNYRLEEQMQPQNHSSRPMHHSQQQMSVAQHQQHREQQQQVREQQMREQMIREQQHREQQALLQQQQLQKQQQHLHRSGGQQNPSPYSSRGQPNVIYSSDGSAVNANASRKVGSIVDYDPLNNYYGSLDPQRASMQPGKSAGAGGHPSYAPSGNVGQPRTQMHHGQPQMPNHSACYRALYDYEAQDVDEVSFVDGDLIIDCTPVDEGWLTGSVQRTGKRGMLPANYVAPAN